MDSTPLGRHDRHTNPGIRLHEESDMTFERIKEYEAMTKVKELLRKEGWLYQWIELEPDGIINIEIALPYHITRHSKQKLIISYDSNMIYVVYSNILKISRHDISAMQLLCHGLNHLNRRLLCGCFILDALSGELSFRSTFIMQDGEMTGRQLNSLMSSAISTVQEQWNVLRTLKEGGNDVAPAELVEMTLSSIIEDGIDDTQTESVCPPPPHSTPCHNHQSHASSTLIDSASPPTTAGVASVPSPNLTMLQSMTETLVQVEESPLPSVSVPVDISDSTLSSPLSSPLLYSPLPPLPAMLSAPLSGLQEESTHQHQPLMNLEQMQELVRNVLQGNYSAMDSIQLDQSQGHSPLHPSSPPGTRASLSQIDAMIDDLYQRVGEMHEAILGIPSPHRAAPFLPLGRTQPLRSTTGVYATIRHPSSENTIPLALPAALSFTEESVPESSRGEDTSLPSRREMKKKNDTIENETPLLVEGGALLESEPLFHPTQIHSLREKMNSIRSVDFELETMATVSLKKKLWEKRREEESYVWTKGEVEAENIEDSFNLRWRSSVRAPLPTHPITDPLSDDDWRDYYYDLQFEKSFLSQVLAVLNDQDLPPSFFASSPPR